MGYKAGTKADPNAITPQQARTAFARYCKKIDVTKEELAWNFGCIPASQSNEQEAVLDEDINWDDAAEGIDEGIEGPEGFRDSDDDDEGRGGDGGATRRRSEIANGPSREGDGGARGGNGNATNDANRGTGDGGDGEGDSDVEVDATAASRQRLLAISRHSQRTLATWEGFVKDGLKNIRTKKRRREEPAEDAQQTAPPLLGASGHDTS
ncbi:hypothetical protein EMIHUDRAFT_195474 [Emiliania huxleyi CCMP1516]|uniref:Uncharacterized protein n=2 Tax=Emiliania huxleyi TaxID=2903 RepID=A0A0D3JHJ7_EMIH1|nr:hypothetical protein EMIHUDRAFT_195474 [Emiliania huxleyi CCMP1516]EOD22982.1 hypothetical protein EMIHUDRAFT_195474 [Emiliania huxleyi CCMP1516]|eukprot:XP_005775411.1 hypothetical protein EMIHUDRAFT_195474 [Emiliania huxleyi CCMP1516]